jgi:hypothetical protein
LTPRPPELRNWKERIVQTVLVKQRLEEVDTDNLWPDKLPRVAAGEEAPQEAEAAVGMPLDPEYRDFLRRPRPVPDHRPWRADPGTFRQPATRPKS